MSAEIEITVEPEDSNDRIRSRYGAFGKTGKIEAAKNHNLSEQDMKKIEEAPSISIGERKSNFADFIVEEVFEGNYQVANDILITEIDTHEENKQIKNEVIKFLENHYGKKVFIRAV